jgi:hypothetical protein
VQDGEALYRGNDHPDVATVPKAGAELYRARGRHAEAAPLLKLRAPDGANDKSFFRVGAISLRPSGCTPDIAKKNQPSPPGQRPRTVGGMGAAAVKG